MQVEAITYTVKEHFKSVYLFFATNRQVNQSTNVLQQIFDDGVSVPFEGWFGGLTVNNGKRQILHFFAVFPGNSHWSQQSSAATRKP